MGAQEILNAMYPDGETLVFGHRGAKAHAPMNTIPAFELAATQGAHGVELDVHLSHDGQLVILHNYTVDETTDGSGIVTEMTLAELKALDAGSWFDSKFTGVQIPTLNEVFEAVGQSLLVNIEIKPYSGESRIEQAVADCITAHRMNERVIVSSFAPSILKRHRRIAPDIPLGYLSSPESMKGPTQAVISPRSYEAEHWEHTMIQAKMMEYAHEAGKIVNTWTVNDPAVARQLRLLGVHGIITDYPDVILEALA